MVVIIGNHYWAWKAQDHAPWRLRVAVAIIVSVTVIRAVELIVRSKSNGDITGNATIAIHSKLDRAPAASATNMFVVMLMLLISIIAKSYYYYYYYNYYYYYY